MFVNRLSNQAVKAALGLPERPTDTDYEDHTYFMKWINHFIETKGKAAAVNHLRFIYPEYLVMIDKTEELTTPSNSFPLPGNHSQYTEFIWFVEKPKNYAQMQAAI